MYTNFFFQFYTIDMFIISDRTNLLKFTEKMLIL